MCADVRETDDVELCAHFGQPAICTCSSTCSPITLEILSDEIVGTLPDAPAWPLKPYVTHSTSWTLSHEPYRPQTHMNYSFNS